MAKNNAGSVILAFLAGGLVGAGVALLFAPSSGEESRTRIREVSQEAKNRAVLEADQAKDRALHAKEVARSKLDDAKLSAKDRALHAKEEARSKLDDAKFGVKAAVDAGKEAFQRTKEELSQHAIDEDEEV